MNRANGKQQHTKDAVVPSNTCSGCGCSTENHSHSWHLNNYYGFSGRFCCRCYDLISHDSHGNPNHPDEYIMMLLRFKG